MNEKIILNQFFDAQDKLVIQSSDLSLDSIANMVKGGAIDITPKYQRRERWTKTKQSALIESFLLNIPVPPIYLAEDEYGKYSVIDGKQRITSIYNFIEKKHTLEKLEKFTEINGLSFETLPDPLINALKIRPYIRVITLLKQSDPNLKYEVFTRLNTGGEKLLPQEIRNAAFESDLNDKITSLSRNPFLMEQLKSKSHLSKPYKEMIDVEYVLRFFTLRDYWQAFNGNMSKAMDLYMQENYRNPSLNLTLLEGIFNKTINLCEIVWGTKAFKRPDGRNEIIQGIYDAQMVAMSYFLRRSSKVISNARIIRNRFNNLYETDQAFQTSMRQFTSNIKQVEYRISTMIDLISNAI